MQPQANPHDDDMPAEIDFSKGARGKFFRPGAKLSLPVYLDEPVQAALAALASAKGVELSTLVNDLLREDIELIEIGPLNDRQDGSAYGSGSYLTDELTQCFFAHDQPCVCVALEQERLAADA